MDKELSAINKELEERMAASDEAMRRFKERYPVLEANIDRNLARLREIAGERDDRGRGAGRRGRR